MAKGVKTILKEGVLLPKIFGEVLDEVLEPALQKLVASTETPLDDVLMAAIYPPLEKELKALATKLWEDLLAEDVVKPLPAVG